MAVITPRKLSLEEKKKRVARKLEYYIKNTTATGVFFGWKDKLKAVLILALIFGFIFLIIVFYPK